MNATATFGDNDVLIVVDVQNDFCPGGALAVPRGEEVVPIVNRMAARFRNVVLTQDWHPRNHSSFASSHPGRQPFETIAAAYGRFCCRSHLSFPANSDSVALMLTLAGADDDGAAEPGPRTVSLLLQS
jgi:nicotinamidase-related amidase